MDKSLNKGMRDDSYVGSDGSIRSFTSWKESMASLRADMKDGDYGTNVPGVVNKTLFARGLPLAVKGK